MSIIIRGMLTFSTCATDTEVADLVELRSSRMLALTQRHHSQELGDVLKIVLRSMVVALGIAIDLDPIALTLLGRMIASRSLSASG